MFQAWPRWYGCARVRSIFAPPAYMRMLYAYIVKHKNLLRGGAGLLKAFRALSGLLSRTRARFRVAPALTHKRGKIKEKYRNEERSSWWDGGSQPRG